MRVTGAEIAVRSKGTRFRADEKGKDIRKERSNQLSGVAGWQKLEETKLIRGLPLSDDNSHEERLLAGRNERSYIRSRCWSTIYKATTNWVITRPLLCAPVPFRILQTIEIHVIRNHPSMFVDWECGFQCFFIRRSSASNFIFNSLEFVVGPTDIRETVLYFSLKETLLLQLFDEEYCSFQSIQPPSPSRPIIEGASSVKTERKKMRFFDFFSFFSRAIYSKSMILKINKTMWILKFPRFKSNEQLQEIRIRETSSKLSNFSLDRVLSANSIYLYIYIYSSGCKSSLTRFTFKTKAFKNQ